MWLYYPSMESPILANTQIAHSAAKQKNIVVGLTLRLTASEKPIPSRAISQMLKTSSELRRDNRGFEVSRGLKKNPGLVGIGFCALNWSGSASRIITNPITAPKTLTRLA